MTTAREDPPWTGPERAGLEGWLRYHRDTLAVKCDGLTPEQLCTRSVHPSSMSLIGLVRHMTEVERSWFQGLVAGKDRIEAPLIYCTDDNLDGDFDDVDPSTVESDMETWRRECLASDGVVAAADLDDTRVHSRWGHTISVRWVMNHMIEEYARHNGHADLLREAIDGSTGE